MGVSKVGVYANCDVTTIAWQTEEPIPGCRGFALARQVKGADGMAKDGFITTWVGFKGGDHKQGESQPSTVWPVQRYLWSDYETGQGQQVRYRVIPMLGPAAKLKQAAASECSKWTPWVTVGTGQTKGFEAYFNRGIVPAQWLSRQVNDPKKFHAFLQQDIEKPGSKNREFLGGPLRPFLLGLLKTAKQKGMKVYAALYELNDPELMAALVTLGAQCSLVLANGAFGKGKPDENADARQQLKKKSKVQVFDRIVTGQHFAHNKFLVFCDKNDNPQSVWTGSTNWTVNGLCTQTNNGMLISSVPLAKAYKARWDALKKAGGSYPKDLAQDGSVPAKDTLNGAPITAWNAPCLKYVDLIEARKHIQAAQQGVLYLMFNPGLGGGNRENSLIQDILALDPTKLFIHGVLNQDPGGKKAPIVILNHKGTQLPAKTMEAILPETLKSAGRKWFGDEFRYGMVMIHSKVIVIDPFGDKPVVMTGSHNLGPKASSSNDDNLAIIENAPGLAAEYAVNIMGVYGHYKWLFNEYLRTKGGTADEKAVSDTYDGNFDDDKWQNWYTGGEHLREIEFWLGTAK